MSILPELENRFRLALSGLVEDPEPFLGMLRKSQDATFGDYQANFAMPLGKRLGRQPRELAAEIVAALDLDDFCDPPEVAGPGFINLKLRDDWIIDRLARAVDDSRLGVPKAQKPRTFVIDYSSPNVAKPMHVGHIRSTVIGASLAAVLRFAGHRVITDNHIGDWGTQFGMIIYGWRHFRDEAAYQYDPVNELARLYRLVRRLMDYHKGRRRLEPLAGEISRQQSDLACQRDAATAEDKKPDKKTKKALRRLESGLEKARQELEELKAKVAAVDADGALSKLADEHTEVGSAVLGETAKLHAGDEENLRLWREFLPGCEDEIDRVYGRLNVTFDHALGESFYHDRLAPIVDRMVEKGIATQSNGAICVFLDGNDVPMLIRKQDGAFLYATTDLATLEYRLETWRPDAILYVVDFRQGMHFEHLFATARLMGQTGVDLAHVSFGTVLGEDGRPFQTRSGETVGLEGLLDEAVRRAAEIVNANDDAKPAGPELSRRERTQVAETVGIAALKYADLAQNRESDYVFSYDKMLAMNGNTATYMQYAYARVRSIFRKGDVDVAALRSSGAAIILGTPPERALAVELLRFGEAIELTMKDYRPNQLTAYLFELAGCYSTFFEYCPVLKADSQQLRRSRLLLCDLTARTIERGLDLLGISVVEKM